eukprot:scaffold133_cov257-Pinguiococcus_pyrenoidosus.AAC.9
MLTSSCKASSSSPSLCHLVSQPLWLGPQLVLGELGGTASDCESFPSRKYPSITLALSSSSIRAEITSSSASTTWRPGLSSVLLGSESLSDAAKRCQRGAAEVQLPLRPRRLDQKGGDGVAALVPHESALQLQRGVSGDAEVLVDAVQRRRVGQKLVKSGAQALCIRVASGEDGQSRVMLHPLQAPQRHVSPEQRRQEHPLHEGLERQEDQGLLQQRRAEGAQPQQRHVRLVRQAKVKQPRQAEQHIRQRGQGGQMALVLPRHHQLGEQGVGAEHAATQQGHVVSDGDECHGAPPHEHGLGEGACAAGLELGDAPLLLSQAFAQVDGLFHVAAELAAQRPGQRAVQRTLSVQSRPQVRLPCQPGELALEDLVHQLQTLPPQALLVERESQVRLRGPGQKVLRRLGQHDAHETQQHQRSDRQVHPVGVAALGFGVPATPAACQMPWRMQGFAAAVAPLLRTGGFVVAREHGGEEQRIHQHETQHPHGELQHLQRPRDALVAQAQRVEEQMAGAQLSPDPRPHGAELEALHPQRTQQQEPVPQVRVHRLALGHEAVFGRRQHVLGVQPAGPNTTGRTATSFLRSEFSASPDPSASASSLPFCKSSESAVSASQSLPPLVDTSTSWALAATATPPSGESATSEAFAIASAATLQLRPASSERQSSPLLDAASRTRRGASPDREVQPRPVVTGLKNQLRPESPLRQKPAASSAATSVCAS